MAQSRHLVTFVKKSSAMFEQLKQVCQRLDSQGIPYMLSGSLALNAYALPRMTRDIDIVVKLEPIDLDRFTALFEDDFYCHKPSIAEEIGRAGMFNLIHFKTSIKIDFIVRKHTPYRMLELERRQKTDVFGFDAWLVSVEDLIISKLEWIQVLQSEKQMEDIRSLLKNPAIDRTYLAHWIGQLGLNTFNLLEI